MLLSVAPSAHQGQGLVAVLPCRWSGRQGPQSHWLLPPSQESRPSSVSLPLPHHPTLTAAWDSHQVLNPHLFSTFSLTKVICSCGHSEKRTVKLAGYHTWGPLTSWGLSLWKSVSAPVRQIQLPHWMSARSAGAWPLPDRPMSLLSAQPLASCKSYLLQQTSPQPSGERMAGK